MEPNGDHLNMIGVSGGKQSLCTDLHRMSFIESLGYVGLKVFHCMLCASKTIGIW